MERERLAGLLDRVGEGDAEARGELMEYIMQQPEGIRVLAFEALEDGGDDTYNQLMLTLADDPNLVIRAPRRKPPVEAEGDTSHLHPIAQQAGREWQAATGARPAPADLLEQLRSGDRARRVQAARALAERADPATVEPLLDAIRSGDRLVGAAAIEALQDIGAPAVPALVRALDERAEQVRWSAAKALSTIADARAVPALVRALESSNYGIRWLAAEGLAHAGRAALVPLLRRLADEKPSTWLRDGAWHVLNKLNVPGDAERGHYRTLAAEVKRVGSANLPVLARQELRRLGEDA